MLLSTETVKTYLLTTWQAPSRFSGTISNPKSTLFMECLRIETAEKVVLFAPEASIPQDMRWWNDEVW